MTWIPLLITVVALCSADDDNHHRNQTNDPKVEQFKTLFPNVDPEKFFRLRDKMDQLLEKELSATVGTQSSEPSLAADPKQVDQTSFSTVNQKSGISDLLFEGDVVLSNKQMDYLEKSLDGNTTTRSKRQAINVNSFYALWPGRNIYFYFNGVSEINMINFRIAAYEFWEANTCLKFFETDAAANAIEVITGQGCYSSIGMTGGIQQLSMGAGCEKTAKHEIGHALGLWHSQSRYDRDSFLTIHLGNVRVGQRHNYNKETTATNNNYAVGYDYGSVMHYVANAFIDSPTGPLPIVPKDPVFLHTMGNDKGSFNDILMINRLYGCDKICVGKPNVAACGNGGMPNPNNCQQCLCPRGYGGATCGQPTHDQCGAIIASKATVTTLKRTVGVTMPAGSYQYRARECTVHIKAPVGQKVEVQIKQITAPWCFYGCRHAGIEVKARKEPRFRGILFCCTAHFGKKVVSATNELPVIFYSSNKVHDFVITYRTVPASTPSTTVYRTY